MEMCPICNNIIESVNKHINMCKMLSRKNREKLISIYEYLVSKEGKNDLLRFIYREVL